MSAPPRSLIRLGFLAALVAGLLLVAAPAFAHVTVRTDNPEAGGFAVYTVRVPNESDTAATITVEVQLPEGLDASRYQPKPGWTLSMEDGVFIAEGGQIAVGEFDEFHFQARNPEEPGDLAFPALQTYDDGEVVEWIGEPDSDEPASVVEIVPAADDTDTAAEPSGGQWGLSLVAVALGALGVLLGGGALLRGRTS